MLSKLTVRGEGRSGGEAERAEAGGQSTDCIAMGKHDAVAGANDGLRIDLIREADTGTEVLVVVVDGRGAVAGVGTMAGKLQGSVDAGDRIGQIWVEEALSVMDFGNGRVEVVAKTQIKGELAE